MLHIKKYLHSLKIITASLEVINCAITARLVSHKKDWK